MPLGAAQIVFLLITATVATFVPRTRIAMMILNTVVSLVGMALVWQLGMDERTERLLGLALGAVFAVNIPLSLSVISSNVAGFTKRSVTGALLFVAYCVGNIVGPQFFLASEAPHYPVSLHGHITYERRGSDLIPDWYHHGGLGACSGRLFPDLSSRLLCY